MQRFLLIFFLLTCGRIYASTDDTPHVSPDGKFIIHNIGDTAYDNHYFEIALQDGTVVYSSQNQQLSELESGAHAEQIAWTRDSRFALFRITQAKFYFTCIFSAPDRRLEIIPPEDNTSWATPVHWTDARTFVVEFSGPHGGKALPGGWHYRKTYRLATQPFKLKCVHTGRTIWE